VTLVVGVTSVGKTTFLHNLVYHLAAGREFLGITPPRPLKVLYVDFESHDGVICEHLETIGTHPNLHFVEPDDLVRGAGLIEGLKELAGAARYDLVVVDPLMDAYPVESENDNAQAITQMLAFRDLARQTETGVVVIHNAGKKAQDLEDDDAFLGRGATARADKADVGINFVRGRGELERALVVAKSRQANLGDRIEFRFAENLGYELIDLDAPGPTGKVTLHDDIVSAVEAKLASGQIEVPRKEIQEAVRLSSSERDKKRLTRALDRLIREERLRRPREGMYIVPEPPPAVNPGGSGEMGSTNPLPNGS
jgi:hypothetical protein